MILGTGSRKKLALDRKLRARSGVCKNKKKFEKCDRFMTETPFHVNALVWILEMAENDIWTVGKSERGERRGV